MSQAAPISGETADRRMLDRLGSLVPHLDPARLPEFGVKTAIAVLLAVGIEFWFNLGMAGSAAITVLIVKSQLLGTTFEKSVLRMVGNLIGCSLGLVFLGLGDQDRIAAALLFTTFSVFCCFNLQRSRFAPAWHWAYTSAGLVFLTHIGSPTESFTYTVERWLEISIGITAITVVSSVLWPARAGKVFERQFTAMLANIAGSIASSRDALIPIGTSSQPSAPGKLATGLPALRDTLHTASRDTSRYERFHAGYESLVRRMQTLVARSTLFAGAVSNLNGTTGYPAQQTHRELVAEALDQLKASIDTLVEIAKRHFDVPATREPSPDSATVRSVVERIHSGIKTAGFSFRDAAAMLYVCETITSVADELDRFTDELLNVEHKSNSRSKLSAVQKLDSDNPPFWKRVDVRKSLACGLIIGLAFVVWIMTNWPAGSLAVFMALLVTSKHCTAPYLPPKAMLPGGTLAIFVGAIVYFCVLPRLDGFWQLAVVLFPFYTICGYLMLSSNAKAAGLASLTAIFATMTFDLQQEQSFSFGHVVGLAYAIIGGMSLAFIVLTCVWSIVPEKMFTRQVGAFFKSCSEQLKTLTSESSVNSTSTAAFAKASAKQLGLCRLWGKLIDYKRLPPGSHENVAALIGTMQSAMLHLIELEDARQRWADASLAEPLQDIARRSNQQFLEVFDGFVRSLDRAEPIPELPDTEGVLRNLHESLEEMPGRAADDEAGHAAARTVLEMTGQYSALSSTIAECHACLRKLDWRTLNQSYF